MGVSALRSEDHGRPGFATERRQGFLDGVPVLGDAAIRKAEHRYLQIGARGQCRQGRPFLGLALGAGTGKYKRPDTEAGPPAREGQQRAAHSDGDIVAMRCQQSDLVDRSCMKLDHAVACPRSHTIHGRSPLR
ncbi:Uncharacterised protein [Mycobacteroides abscessus subsp. abscessus]|nr:Uncharacterised protein [Mycobacteroides abscessus subsp. abscessus]